MEKKLLGEYLIAEKLVTKKQLESALERQAQNIKGGHAPLLGTVLVEMGAIEERALVPILQRQALDRKAMGV